MPWSFSAIGLMDYVICCRLLSWSKNGIPKPMNICHIFFKLQARERLLIHRNNICIMKKLRLTQVSVSTSLHRLSSRLPREFSLALIPPSLPAHSGWRRSKPHVTLPWTPPEFLGGLLHLSLHLLPDKFNDVEVRWVAWPFQDINSFLFQVLGCLIGAMGWCKVMLEHKVIISKEFIYRWKQVSI